MGRRRGTNRRARGTHPHAVRQTRAQAAAIRELTASTSNSDNNNNNVVADITVHAVDGVADTSLGSHGNQATTSTTAVSSSATAVLSSAQPSASTSTATATSPTASGIGGATGGVGGFALPVSTQQVQQNQWQWGHGQQQSASSGIQGNGEQIQNQNVVGNVGLLSGLHGQSQVNMSLNATDHDFCWSGKPIYHLQKQGNIHIFQNKYKNPHKFAEIMKKNRVLGKFLS